MKKLPVDELLRRACSYAVDDVAELIDCHAECKSPDDLEYVAGLKDFLAQLKEYRKKRWGGRTVRAWATPTPGETK